MHVCVYCASSNAIPAEYFEAACSFGVALAARGWSLVYGGGSVGLMGELARAVHSADGIVIGIIPRALLDREVGYMQADELVVTATLRERKQLMDDRAEAFVALPGGFGTLEELVEIITLKQLGYHTKPIVIVNLGGYFDPLVAQFERCFTQGFTNERHRVLYTVVATVEDVFEALEQRMGAA
jgi:hypothetical protein